MISAVLGSPQLLNKWNLELQSETSDVSSSQTSSKSFEVKTDICFSKCVINGNVRQSCLSECKKKTQPESVPALRTVSSSTVNKCASTCYTHCYRSNNLEQVCFDSCLEQCQPRESNKAASDSVSTEGQLKANACQQGCYIKCLVNGSVSQPCYNECANFCPASEEAKALTLTAVPTNCGQICFQQCYVNFQMIANCYLPCADSCIQTSTSGLTESIKETSEETQESSRPVPSNQCEYECFVSSWADSFFYETTYTTCKQRICGQGLELKDEKVLTGPNSCIKQCRTVGKVDPTCYDSCLNKKEKQELKMVKFGSGLEIS